MGRCYFGLTKRHNKMKTSATVQKIEELLKSLKTDDLKSFLVTCPDNLTEYVMNELEKRMTPEEFIKFSNEF